MLLYVVPVPLLLTCSGVPHRPRSVVPCWRRTQTRACATPSAPTAARTRSTVPCPSRLVHWTRYVPWHHGDCVFSRVEALDVRGNCESVHSLSVSPMNALGCGLVPQTYRPDFTMTAPSVPLGPHPSWFDPKKVLAVVALSACRHARASTCHPCFHSFL